MKIGGKNYNRCSKSMPCPVCQRSDWCLVSDDGTNAICKRTKIGSVQNMGKSGHRFRLDGKVFDKVKSVTKTQDYLPNPAIIKEAYLSLDFSKESLCPLAIRLGVSISSLQSLGVGKSGTGWCFPMFNERHELVGLHKREFNGFKCCVRHSQLGVFLPKRFNYKNRAIVLEGGSDTAAMLDQGYNAIGRPNTTAGMYALCCLLRNQKSVIVADNEGPKIHPITGMVSYPGPESAFALSSMLLNKSCVVVCPVKDPREWIASGGFSDKWFEQLIRMPYKSIEDWKKTQKGEQ